jgi:hypothetical protein
MINKSRSGGAWLAAALLLFAAFTPGCDAGGEETTSGSTSGSGSSSGAGGAGGGSMASGVQATEIVAGGDVVRSSKYKMVYTFGQPTQNQHTSKSSGYRVQGGLIGATESLP